MNLFLHNRFILHRHLGLFSIFTCSNSMGAPMTTWIGVLWGTIPQEYWKIPVWKKHQGFMRRHLSCKYHYFLKSAKPTSSKVEEERDASLCEEPVLNFSQSRTLRVWPLWEDQFHHMVAGDNGKIFANK